MINPQTVSVLAPRPIAATTATATSSSRPTRCCAGASQALDNARSGSGSAQSSSSTTPRPRRLRLPPIPAARPEATYEVVGAGHRIAVIQLWCTEASEDTKIPNVHVFDLLTGTWRHGAASPTAHPPWLSACASDGVRRVFFAGGLGHLEKFSSFAMSYDVEDDTWVRLPDMVNPRSVCYGFFNAGTFYVIGGYNDTSPPLDMLSADVFHVSTSDWTYEGGFIPASSGDCSFVTSPNTGKMYCFQFNYDQMTLWVREDKGWNLVCYDVELDFIPYCCLMAWKGGFVLADCCQRADNFVLHFLSLEEGSNRRSWKTEKLPLQQEMCDNVKVNRMYKFSSKCVITSGCYLQV